MGEATSDYLVKALHPVPAVALGAVVLAGALALQFFVRHYVAWIYWFAVVMVAVFGTMAADVLHVQFHVPYAVTSTLFAAVLTGVFVVWYKTEGTLSIHTITTPRREVFYWSTVMATFALGTALGDLTAHTLGLGYLTAGVMFCGLIAVPAIGYWWWGFNEVFAFWFAYIVTRPLGASFADYLGKPQTLGGLGIGDGVVALILSGAIVIMVAYVSITKMDVRDEPYNFAED